MSGARWWETRWFAILAVGLAAVPLLWPTIPPLVDVPGHMGRYRVMLGTDAATLDQWYRFAWKPIGYLGVDLLVAGLGPLVGLEPAVKIVVVAIPMLTVAGMLWLSREAHGRVQPVALFALPLAYHMAFQYGFLNFTLSMALALNALALWLRLGRQGRFRLRAALSLPLSCAVWAAHLFGWLVLGLLAFCAELMRGRAGGRGWIASGWRGALACLPLALPFAMFLRWVPGGEASSDYWLSLKFKPGWIAMALRDRWAVLDLGSVMLIVSLIYGGVRSANLRQSPALAAGAIGLLLLFLAMPFGAAFADARIIPYTLMVALLAIRVDEGASSRQRRALALGGLAFFTIRIAANTLSLGMEGREWDRHLRALDHLPRGARVAAFVTDICPQPWRIQKLNHLPGMAIVRRSAFSNDQYDLGGTALMHVVAPGVAGYAMDPSQIVTPAGCGTGVRSLPDALGGLPRDRFDHVWLIEPTRVDRRLLAGLTPVWTNGGDFLLRIEPRRLSRGRSAN